MQGLGKGHHHGVALFPQALQMCTNNRFTDAGIAYNHREAAVLRMNAKVAGALSTALVEVIMPEAAWELCQNVFVRRLP